MALVLNEEQTMLRDSARGLITDKAPVSHLRQLRDNKDKDGFSRELWKSFRRDGIFRPAGAGGVRRQRARLRRGRHRHGGNRPHADAVAVPGLRGAGGVGAVARRQQGAEMANICRRSPTVRCWRARDRRRRQASSAQTKMKAVRSGNGFRLKGAKAFVVDGHVADLLVVAARTAGGAGEREGHDAVPGRSQSQGHRDRAHRHGRFAQCRAHRVRQCRGQCRQRARRGRSGRRGAGRRAEHRPRRGGLRNGRRRRRGVRPHRRLPEGAQAVRQTDRRISGAAAPHRASLCRDRDHPRRRAEGAADAGWGFRQRRRRGRGREGARRLDRDARGAGRRADAWRHGHDRPVRHRLVHEARARLPGIVRRLPISTPINWRG